MVFVFRNIRTGNKKNRNETKPKTILLKSVKMLVLDYKIAYICSVQ